MSFERIRAFHGWKIVAAGAVIQAALSGLIMQSFTSYSVLLREEFGWSATMVSIAFALNRAESGLLGPAQGWAVDRWGPKAIMRLGAVVSFVGFLWFSRLDTAWEFYLSFLLMAIGASLCGFLTIVTTTVNWFERKRALALGISSGGFALGGIMTPGVVWVMERFGWRNTAVVSAFVLLIVVFSLASLFHHRPSDIGQEVDGLTPEERDAERAADTKPANPVSEVHFTAKEAMRTRAFWLISGGHASALLVVSAVMLHLAQYLTDEQEFTLQKAGFVVGGVTLSQLIGQFAGGYLGDRMNKRIIVIAAMVGHIAGLLLLAYATAEWMVWVFVPLHGLAWGARGPLMQAIRADYFGSTSFGKIMGFSSMIVMLGMMGGPIIAGVIDDATGSFTIGFTVLALMAGMGFVFFALAAPPDPPVRHDDQM